MSPSRKSLHIFVTPPSVLLAQSTISTAAASHFQEIPLPLGILTPMLGDTALMICDRRIPYSTGTGIVLLLCDRIQSIFPPEVPWVVTKHLSLTVTAVGVHARLYTGFRRIAWETIKSVCHCVGAKLQLRLQVSVNWWMRPQNEMGNAFKCTAYRLWMCSLCLVLSKNKFYYPGFFLSSYKFKMPIL